MTGTRILDLPYAFETRYVPPRARSERSEVVRGTVQVAVPDVVDAAAPLAFTLIRQSGKRVVDGETRHPYRVFDGRLYVPLSSFSPVTVEAFERDVATRRRWQHGPFAGANRDGSERPGWAADMYPPLPLSSERLSDLRQTVKLPTQEEFYAGVADGRTRPRHRRDDGEERKGQAAKILERGLVVVDGEVWTVSMAWEPHWYVAHGREEITLGLRLKRDPLSYVTAFRLDQREEAATYAADVSRTSGLPLLDEGHAVEMHLPESLKRDSEVMLAEQVLAAVGAPPLNRADFETWPPEAEEAMASLYRLMRKMRDTGRPLLASGAAKVFSLATSARDSFAGMAEDDRGHHAREFVDRSEIAMLRWERVAERRPDLADAADLEAIAAAIP